MKEDGAAKFVIPKTEVATKNVKTSPVGNHIKTSRITYQTTNRYDETNCSSCGALLSDSPQREVVEYRLGDAPSSADEALEDLERVDRVQRQHFAATGESPSEDRPISWQSSHSDETLLPWNQPKLTWLQRIQYAWEDHARQIMWVGIPLLIALLMVAGW